MFGEPALYFFAIICSIVYKILVYCLSANPLALCIDDSADYAYIAIDCQQVQRFNLDSFEVVQTETFAKRYLFVPSVVRKCSFTIE